MALLRTRGEMREAALVRADLDGYASVTDAANLLLQSRIRGLYDLLISCHGSQFYRKTTTSTTVKDQSLYTYSGDFKVPDFYRFTELQADDGTAFVLVPAFDDVLLPLLLAAEKGGPTTSVYTYRRALRPTGIEVRPAPTGTTHTLTLGYVPAAPQLDTDDSTFDGINGWERWAEIGTAIDLRNREELDVSSLVAELQATEAAITELAGTRDTEPAKVRLTRPSWRRWRYWRNRSGDDL